MKFILLIPFIFSWYPYVNQQEKSTIYSFAIITDLEGVTIASEIFENQLTKEENTLNSFKLSNTNEYYKLLVSKGYKLPPYTKNNAVVNLIELEDNWDVIVKKYESFRKNSLNKFIVIDRDLFSIKEAANREVLIRE